MAINTEFAWAIFEKQNVTEIWHFHSAMHSKQKAKEFASFIRPSYYKVKVAKIKFVLADTNEL